MKLGLALFMVGASMMDSEVVLFPAAMVIAGMLLIARGVKKCLN